MDFKHGPTLRAQWLGQRLRELRETTGFTLRQAGEFLHRSQGTVSRFESGEYPIRRPEVMALLDLYHVSDQRQRAALLKFAEEVWQTGWWDGYANEFAGWFVDYVWLESRAQEIQFFDNTLLPGLLQTEEYAATAMRVADPDITDDQLTRGVELRMARQERLTAEDAPRLRAIVDEALLYRIVGGAEVLRPQLAHIREVARLPHVEIRLLPLSTGAHASPPGPFRLFTMDNPYTEVAYVETLTGALYIEPPDAIHYVRAYDRLWKATLGADESAALIAAAMEELE